MPELKIFIDDLTMENLRVISERSGISVEELVKEIIVRNLPIIRTVVEKSDINSLCKGLGPKVEDAEPVKIIEAAQVLAAIKRDFGEIPESVEIENIKLSKAGVKTKEKRIGYLVDLGIARIDGNKLIFDIPELANELLNCAKTLEKLHGKRLIENEERAGRRANSRGSKAGKDKGQQRDS